MAVRATNQTERVMFVKVRFTGRQGATAGLVVEAKRFFEMSVAQVAAMFPKSEYGKMGDMSESPVYPTWEAAFAHDFDARPVVECPKAAIVSDLQDLQNALIDGDVGEDGELEVRLWVRPNGDVELAQGAIDYDTDHSGVCASTTLCASDPVNLADLAVQMWNECVEQLACSPECYPDMTLAYARVSVQVGK